MVSLKNLLMIVVVTLIGVSTILFTRTFQDETFDFKVAKIETALEVLSHEREENELLIEKVKDVFLGSLQISNLSFPDSLRLFKVNGEETRLSEIQNSSLVFFFKEANCQLCVDQEILTINQISKEDSGLNVTVLAALNKPRDIRFLRRNINDGIDVYGVDLKEISLFLNGIVNAPFYFFLDKQGMSRYHYLPTLELDGLSTEYFDLISSIKN